MSSRLGIPVILFAILLLTPSLYGQNLKVGIVNTEKIYSGYLKAQETQKSFQAERKTKQDELAKKQSELVNLKKEYEDKKSYLKENDKKEYDTKIANKEKEIKGFTQQTDKYLVQRNQTLVQERLKEILEVIGKFANENKYDLIIENKNIPYFSQVLDVSDKIIERLNSLK
ncbi:MAG: OmpH family outer membrane protein [Candidatus Omnitrophota bacterium]